jgi:lipoprotein-anchoring transpeptidase ErfK/SrfK
LFTKLEHPPMSLSRFLSGLTLAAIVLAGGLASAPSAKAEDLVDFLWGGSPEYGGGRSIVSFDPQYKPGQIIVSFSDRRLYLITKPGEAMTYPVAIPTGEARWQGVTAVTSKRVNPPWTPTPDMVRANPRLPRWVPGGHPMNPLGIRAMYLGTSAYRIHGTDAPWTIGQAVSHGCIRLTNDDVLDLYPRVPVGTRVTVTWQQFQTHQIASGDSVPRYRDADSNPRAATASASSSSATTASTATASEAASSSSDSSAYSYRAYGAGKAASARTASNQSSGGSLESLFSAWDDQPKQSTSQSASHDAEQNQASRDATQDGNDQAVDQKPWDKKKASEQADSEPLPFEKAPKQKAAEAKSVAEPSAPAEPEVPKKKVSSASSAKKKATTASASVALPPSDPTASPALAVPDPVKPSAVLSPSKESDASPAATKASASAAESLPVQKAAVRVQ